MDSQALDRWITGNYGQDQYAEDYCYDCEFMEDDTCPYRDWRECRDMEAADSMEGRGK